MRLLRIRLEHVRGVGSCEVTFARDGVTIVEAPNEAGKSTLMDAVDVLLEVKDSSNAQRVKELQPVTAEVGSTIEVELLSGATHLTCTKTYNKQRGTVLDVHAPVRRQVRGAEAHDQLREILESDVDLDLYAALRFDQGRGLDAVSLEKSRVLAARLDAVAGGTGRTDGDALLDRVVREYGRYFTPTGSLRKSAKEIDALVDGLRAEQADVLGRLDELSRDVDELTAIDSELPVLRRRLAEEIDPRVAELGAQLRSIETRRGVVAQRTAERERAQADHQAARRTRVERDARREAITDLESDVGQLQERIEPTRVRQRELEDRLTTCDEEFAKALEAGANARREREVAELLLDLVRERQLCEQLAARHDRALRAREEARQAHHALQRIALGPRDLDEIRRAERAQQVAAAALAAGAPTVQVRAVEPATLEADGVAVEVAAGSVWEAAVADRFDLEVPGAVEVRVRAGGSINDLQRALDEATEACRQRCAAVGAHDPADAERLAEERSRHEAQLERRQESLQRELGDSSFDQLATELAEAEARRDALETRCPDGVADPGSDTARAQERLDVARPAAEAAEERLGELRAARDSVRDELAGVRQRAATDEAVLEQRRRQLLAEQEALLLARSECSDEELTAREARAAEDVRVASDILASAQDELAELDPDAVAVDEENWRRQRGDAQERIRTLGERRAGLRARLELAGEDGLGELAQQLEQRLVRAEADQRRVHARARAARSLHDALTTAREEAYRAYRAPLADRILEQARLLYRRDVDITLGDDLAIVSRTLDGATLAWDQLSAGAREQLAILSGLAAARLAGNDGVPFVLDDALGYTDPGRLERLGALIGRTTDAQVIVLTCVAERFRHVGGASVVRLEAARGGGDDRR